MSFAFLVCLLLHIAETTRVPAYRVTISSSHQSPIAFDVGNVQLSCSVAPLPDGPVEYRWTVVPEYVFAIYPSPSKSSLPNTTINFNSYETVRNPTYYCHAYANGSKVATGKHRFAVQGFLQYVTTPVVKLSSQGNVVLQYRVANHYETSSIKTTHWFYKGWCIDCYSYNHYLLDLNNTRLTIINASENDIGQYEVRVTELDFYGTSNARCDALALDLLQQYAFFAPVVFHVTMNENIVMPQHTQSKLTSLYGKINNTLIFSTSYGRTMYTSPYTSIYIYADGMRDSSLTNTGKPFHGTTSQLLMLNITQYNKTMAGEYTIVIQTFICFYSIFFTLLPGCNSNYYHKICYSFSIDLDFLDLVKEVSITTFDVPQVIIQAGNKVVQQRRDNDVTGLVTLNCSAEGGNPEEYTVQLMKEGEQLMSTTSGPAVLLYSPSHYQQQFGLFTCSVINEYFNINKSVLIQERASIQGLWLFSVPDEILHNTLEMQTTIKHVIVNTMNSISSSWSITNDSLHNCSTDTTPVDVYYTCDLVYSSNSGTITASTIITRTQEWLLQQEDNIVIRINEATLELSKLCLLQRGDSSMATCSRVREKLAEPIALSSTRESPSASGLPTIITAHTNNNAGAVTGGFIGGFLGGLLTCLFGIAIFFIIKYILSKRKTSTTTGTEDIELQANTAYDTVKYEQPPQQHARPPPCHAQPTPRRIQPPPRRAQPPPRRAQPPPQDTRDHSTYENVVTNYKISSFMHSTTKQST